MRFRKLKQQSKQQHQNNPDIKKVDYVRVVDKIKAFITDMFMIYVPILYILAYVVMGGKDEFQASELAPLVAVSGYGIVYAIFISKSGQTPGKKAYNMKVVDDATHERISFVRAICRYIAFLFSATILLGLFTGFYRKDKKPLHDVLCKTVEIQSDK